MTAPMDLVAHDPTTTAKGQKSALIFRAGGATAFWRIPGECRPLFDPSPYSKGDGRPENTRLSLCLAASDEALSEAKVLDDWAIQYALAHSEQFFGKTLSRDQVSDRYSAPVLKTSEKYAPCIKIKVVLEGRGQPNYWTETKEKRDAPSVWQNSTIAANVRIIGFWFLGPSFGLTLQLADAMVSESAAAACPV